MSRKVALVTGSTSGIGIGIAHRLGKSGYDVIITGLGDKETIDGILGKLKSLYKGTFHYVDGDLANDEGVAQMCAEVMGIYPDGVDILVNNAGIQHVAKFDEYPTEMWHKLVAVNLTAPFLLMKHFLPYMKKKGWGRIVNIASLMARISTPGKTPYSGTKAGVAGMTRGVALEAAEFGVTCNAISPGFVDTALIRKQISDKATRLGVSEQQIYEEFSNAHPNKKLVPIDEVAGLINYLCSEESSSINGADLSIDTGITVQ